VYSVADAGLQIASPTFKANSKDNIRFAASLALDKCSKTFKDMFAFLFKELSQGFLLLRQLMGPSREVRSPSFSIAFPEGKRFLGMLPLEDDLLESRRAKHNSSVRTVPVQPLPAVSSESVCYGGVVGPGLFVVKAVTVDAKKEEIKIVFVSEFPEGWKGTPSHGIIKLPLRALSVDFTAVTTSALTTLLSNPPTKLNTDATFAVCVADGLLWLTLPLTAHEEALPDDECERYLRNLSEVAST